MDLASANHVQGTCDGRWEFKGENQFLLPGVQPRLVGPRYVWARQGLLRHFPGKKAPPGKRTRFTLLGLKKKSLYSLISPPSALPDLSSATPRLLPCLDLTF